MLPVNPTNQPQALPNPSGHSGQAKNASKTKIAGRWTKEEHQRFIEGLKKFGKNWKQVEEHVKTRNGAQIRSHAQKFFLRLEREFDMKFDDFDGQDSKKKFEETLNKLQESGYSNDYPSGETLTPEKPKVSTKIDKTLSPVQESAGRGNMTSLSTSLMPSSVRTSALSQSNSPKLNHFEPPQLRKRPSRKMSEDILHTIDRSSNSLFDIIISKLRAGEHDSRIMSPKLSDFLDLSSSRKSSFNANEFMDPSRLNPNQGFVNSSFRLNMRKMSEDNVLVNLNQPLNGLRGPELSRFDDVELISKKFKVN